MTDAHLSPLARWLRLAALSPLLAVATSIDAAIALAIALPGTLIFTAALAPVLRRRVPESQRPVALALVAAVIATAIDLLLQAACYEIARPLHDWLPLLGVVPVLFDRADHTGSTAAATMRAALLRSAASIAGLLAGAALRSILPSEAGIAACLIASGLALGLIARFAPLRPADSDNAMPVTRTRARVTGPLR